ncbi:patched domain-containing protein 3-like isoform X2 [Acanthaster planci]|uniref:Patched domain-containing protein 3-like isoform X2 n=1 Tax=Acanthaster planci TaxID=133434 RepID=A0A8B7YDI5_ACAPL|nr:patched domain-containing protein 3-like isoform X2 [Acanthaster planci]XP_022090451.1 patched domain-containing protein 3-like isoform X2 [Acanthaster planci]
MAKFDCFNQVISRQFYRYGRLIARRPAIFLIVPLIVAGCLSSGMIFLTIETDAAYLFTPDNSRARDELAEMAALFPVNYEKFLPNRVLTTQEFGGSVVITTRDGSNILREEVMAEIIHLDNTLRSLEIQAPGSNSSITYADICCHFTHDQCLEDPVLKLLNYSSKSVTSMNLTYPFSYIDLIDLPVSSTDISFDFMEGLPFGSVDQLAFQQDGIPDLSFLIPTGPQNISINIGASLGGVVLYENSDVIRSAKALNIMYFLRSGTEEERILAEEWERAFLETFLTLFSGYLHIEVSVFASTTLSDELIAMATRVMPRFCITFSLLIGFAVGSCMMMDWVFSKPWLGQFGVISAMLAIASSMGLLSFCGLPFNEVSASMPFLAIGIGIDDMFIMLAAWRKTSIKLSIEERLGQTYAEAAVSITITSITDALAFGIGSITRLPAIRVFCLYSGMAIIFDYLYQISFFGACMVYTGRREAKRKHCTTLKPVLPKDEAPSEFYRLFCSGGVSKQSPTGEPDDHAIMGFFRDYYGPFITSPSAKIITVILYGLYVGAAIFGCLSLTEGMQYKDIFSDDSYAHHYMSERAEYFTAFAAPISVVINEPVAYWEEDIQEEIENVTRTFESVNHIYDSRFSDSWLRKYLEYLEMENIYDSENATGLDQQRFLAILQEDFLTNPLFEHFVLDVKFENISGQNAISASRLIFLPGNLTTTKGESELMLAVRAIADNASLPLFISSPPFEFFEQYLVVLPNTMQNLIIATVSMCIISLVFIPHPISAAMITVCVISIELGVIGLMSLWGVSMDGVSMINIILCIGFSVDFSAHITYSFVTAPCRTGNQAAIFALHSLGMPILQGAASTVLGIIAIANSPAYIFRSFFKTMFLVMTLGLLHGILFLPVLLTLLRPCMRLGQPKPKPASDVQTTTKEDSAARVDFDVNLEEMPHRDLERDLQREECNSKASSTQEPQECEAFL